MLVLSRKPGESIQIGHNITVRVIECRGNRVRLGIDAPDEIDILRGELADTREQWIKCPVESEGKFELANA